MDLLMYVCHNLSSSNCFSVSLSQVTKFTQLDESLSLDKWENQDWTEKQIVRLSSVPQEGHETHQLKYKDQCNRGQDAHTNNLTNNDNEHKEDSYIFPNMGNCIFVKCLFLSWHKDRK